MSIWTRIADALAALAKGEPLWKVFEHLRGPRERSIAFTIAVIALGAKAAKADGTVTRAEVTAFREVFYIRPEDEEQAARVFNLARTDAAGYEVYAARIAAMFYDDPEVLFDLMEGLFHIAIADGNYNDLEDNFLSHVAEIFGLDSRQFRALRTRFVPDAEPDPYDVLGVHPDMTYEEMRRIWRQLVRESHPDQLMARGVPEEAIKMAEQRLVAINRAWEEIELERAA